MGTDVWGEARWVYVELFEATEGGRATRLAQCSAEVRAEVESLLRADRDAGSFLEHSPHDGLPLGARCGAYRILEVQDDGDPKLLDFGIAKPIDREAPDLTAALDQRLTLVYASPEPARRSMPPSPPSATAHPGDCRVGPFDATSTWTPQAPCSVWRRR